MKIFNIIYNIVAITITLIFLFTAGIMFTGTEVFAVATPSMETEIPEGSLVFVREAQVYNEGDVITAKLFSGNTFTHRIVSVDVEKGLFYTKGDSNPTQDPLPTAEADIIGKVVLCVPYLGLLALNFNSTTVIFIVAAVLVALMLIRFILHKKSAKEATEIEKNQ
ncbi:MAG: signal peptidase I [Clostridia bacterium]|nr:signal peptidase I [Clostridia bacterium]